MAAPLQKPEIQEITTSAELAVAAESWRSEPALALDTEFVRERTFFAQLGLIQIADSQRCYLVDPIAIADLRPLGDVLTNPTVVKVAHSVSEDLEILYHCFGSFPTPLFDTQVAAALDGMDSSMGYRRLVSDFFGIELAKEHTRTNWLRRPLSPEQKVYAARDVEHLLPAYQRLSESLGSKGRLDWVFEETERRADASRILPDPEVAYFRLSGTGRLDRRRLAVAQRLAAWRERRARERDVPRSFILKDSALLAIARNRPTHREALAEVPDLGPKQRERLAERIFGVIREVEKLPADELPPTIPSLPRGDGTQKALNALVGRVRSKAEELEIPPTALASRREIKELLLAVHEERVDPPPPPFDGWRWEVVGRELLQAL